MIIVTGAGGFIGSALIWELNQHGVTDIIAVDNFETSSKWKNLIKRKISDLILISDLEVFLNSQNSKKVDAILHMGAQSSTSEENMDFLIQNNFGWSKTLYHWCQNNNARYIYASSCSTYGDGSKGFDDRTDPHDLEPMNRYGYSKTIFDRWIINQKEAFKNSVGLKFSNVYGPNEYHKGEQASVAYKAHSQIKENRKMSLFKSHRKDFEDGKQMRDFVYIKDLTSWTWQILNRSDVNGIFNMGFGKARTWLDLAQSAFHSLDVPLKIDWIDIPDHLKEHYQYFTEAKMEKLLSTGLEPPKWNLEAGISDYYKNYLETKDPYL